MNTQGGKRALGYGGSVMARSLLVVVTIPITRANRIRRMRVALRRRNEATCISLSLGNAEVLY